MPIAIPCGLKQLVQTLEDVVPFQQLHGRTMVPIVGPAHMGTRGDFMPHSPPKQRVTVGRAYGSLRSIESDRTPGVVETEHRNAVNLENPKTPCSLAFSGDERPGYRAGFLNRVSQVRILPRARSRRKHLIPVPQAGERTSAAHTGSSGPTNAHDTPTCANGRGRRHQSRVARWEEKVDRIFTPRWLPRLIGRIGHYGGSPALTMTSPPATIGGAT
jgi:hypothetical protein